MIATTFLWGLSAVITKTAIGDTPESFRPFIFNGIRIPAGTLLLFAALKLSGKPARVSKLHIPLIAAVSFFGMFEMVRIIRPVLANKPHSPNVRYSPDFAEVIDR